MSSAQTKKPGPSFEFKLCGVINGHNDAVTAISTSTNPSNKDIFLSSSRGLSTKKVIIIKDSTVLVWKITAEGPDYAVPKTSLKGHSHFVSDVKISYNSSYAISSSWDRTLRLWDLNTGKSIKRFVGHTKEVLSVSFSAMDSRQIVSGSADKSIKLWNTVAECKADFSAENNGGGHTDWVTCVRFSPNPDIPLVVSCGRDNVVKVWDMQNFALKLDFVGHKGYLNCVAVSPDGTLCASGGQDGTAMLWDLGESKFLYSLESGNTISALVFSPTNYWLCTASGASIKIWDLRLKKVISDVLSNESSSTYCSTSRGPKFSCTALAWSSDGNHLYAGYSNGEIRVWNCVITSPVDQSQKIQPGNNIL